MEIGQLYKIQNRIHGKVVFYEKDKLISYMKARKTANEWMWAPQNTTAMFMGYFHGKKFGEGRTYSLCLFIWENEIRAVLADDCRFTLIKCENEIT